MNGNSETGTLSLEQAVERMMQPLEAETGDETAEPEADEGIAESDTPEEAEEEAEADDDEDGGEEAEPEYEVETAEGKQKVKLQELLDGFLRTADYTRKTQAVAEERKAVERAKAELAQYEKQLSEQLQAWAVPTEQEPNWAELATKLTPQDFNLRRVQWEQRQRQRDTARAEFQRLQASQRAQMVKEERDRLFEAIPEWRDQAKFEAAAQRIAQNAPEYGFAPDEIAMVVDHRMIRVLNDAIAYRELQKAKPAVDKKTTQIKQALKPGAKPDKAKSQEAARQKMRDELRKTGDLRTAAQLLLR